MVTCYPGTQILNKFNNEIFKKCRPHEILYKNKDTLVSASLVVTMELGKLFAVVAVVIVGGLVGGGELKG